MNAFDTMPWFVGGAGEANSIVKLNCCSSGHNSCDMCQELMNAKTY